MRSLVVYESMFGNTRRIAEAIARGLRAAGAEVSVAAAADVAPDALQEVDLLVAGGPTHVHTLSRASTRADAIAATRKPGSRLVLDPSAEGTGMREWLGSLGHQHGKAVAFDTRLPFPPAMTGRASRKIGQQLRHHGFTPAAKPGSFLVTKDNELAPGEEERAERWGSVLAVAA